MSRDSTGESNDASNTSANASGSVAHRARGPLHSSRQNLQKKQKNNRKHQESLNDTWKAFKTALYSPQPFSEWHWIQRLAKSLLRHFHREILLQQWQRFIPTFAVVLIAGVGVLYARVMHDHVVVRRWCCGDGTGDKLENKAEDAGETDTLRNGELCGAQQSGCWWSLLHASWVGYILTMILWNYLWTVFTSPGVALPPTISNTQKDDEKSKHKSNEAFKGLVHNRKPQGRGGCCFFPPPAVHSATERTLVSSYGALPTKDEVTNGQDDEMLATTTTTTTTTTRKTSAGTKVHNDVKVIRTIWLPSPRASYCSSCDMARPARCHHCSVCQRCVLQMDHHCPWMNNCIGLSNHRTFLLTLVYISLGCLYGACMLYRPFQDVVLVKIAQATANKEGNRLLVLPSLMVKVVLGVPSLWKLLCHFVWKNAQDEQLVNGAEEELVVQIVFPFLLGVGVVMTCFFADHVRQTVFMGRTTLERLEWLGVVKDELLLRQQVQQEHECQQGTSQVQDGNHRRWMQKRLRLWKGSTPLTTSTSTTNISENVGTTTTTTVETLYKNPFVHESWTDNLHQVLGPQLWLAFLPVRVEAPPPSVPKFSLFVASKTSPEVPEALSQTSKKTL